MPAALVWQPPKQNVDCEVCHGKQDRPRSKNAGAFLNSASRFENAEAFLNLNSDFGKKSEPGLESILNLCYYVKQ